MNKTRKITLTGIFLALAILLPFVTGQIPEFGKMLTPMHFPVIIGSLFVGPIYGLIIGVVSPILRQLLFGMPPFPMSVMMAIELGAYGLLTGLVFTKLKQVVKNEIVSIYSALLIAMVVGRVLFALSLMMFTGANNFLVVFFGTFTGSFIGILLQLVLIPILYLRLNKVS